MGTTAIKKISCLGAGVVGAGWATNFLMKGYSVNLYDVSEEFLNKARKQIEKNFAMLSGKGIYSRKQVDDALALLSCTSSIEDALRGVQFIQESGPENYAVKQSILQEVDRYAETDAIFASSTSGLLITEIARYSAYPKRCIGAHPYNPPHLIPLVELSKGDYTSQETLETTLQFYKSLGKEPIVLQKEALGFIANRLQVALYREAVDLVVRGVCSVEDVDKAVCFGPGLRFGLMGPNLIFQLGGGPHGIKGILAHIGPSVEMWWADMADWKKWPEGWGDLAQEGVCQEMAHRSPLEGRTNEEITLWRDNQLLELLKLHQKL